MDDSHVESIASSMNEESSAQRQARLRRQRREAKIKAGGSARLEKITNLSGRPAETSPPASTAPPLQPSSPYLEPSEDPEEIDITNHPFTTRLAPSPLLTNNRLTQTDMRHLFQDGAPPNMNSTSGGPGRQGQGTTYGEDQDPMMKMLQQIMGGTSEGLGGGENGDDGLPPGLAAMLGGGMGGSGSNPQEDRYGYFWKIIHAVFALSLGIYVTAMTSFSGSRLSRATISEGDDVGVKFFWVFATTELVLQSSRFFLERGKTNQGGLLRTVAGFLPEPWKGYMGLVSRYSGIYSTIVEDATAVVFVLGAVAWWQGLAA